MVSEVVWGEGKVRGGWRDGMMGGEGGGLIYGWVLYWRGGGVKGGQRGGGEGEGVQGFELRGLQGPVPVTPCRVGKSCMFVVMRGPVLLSRSS